MGYDTGVCNFCGTGCGNLIRTGDNRIQGVFPLPGHPVSKGRLCVRGWHIHELLNTEDRILRPLVRRDGRLEPASWDEALTLVAERLAGCPGDKIAFAASPRSSNEDNYLLGKLARTIFGSNHLSLASDGGHRNAVDVLLEGAGWPAMTGTLGDIEGSDLIVVLGADITKQNPIIGSEIHKAARKGANLITICSRSTQIAKLSRKHIQLQPGTKRVLLAAAARILIEEKLTDSAFIRDHTAGLENFAGAVGKLDMGAAERVTGIPGAVMREFAITLAKSKRAQIFFSSGISGLDRETIAVLFNLCLAAGKVGTNGCGFNPVAGICNIVGGYDMGMAPDLLPGYAPLADSTFRKELESLWGKPLRPEPGRPLLDLIAGAPDRLKSLVIVDHDEEIVRFPEHLKKLEFVVYLGSFTNRFSEFADVVLPTTTYAEADGTYTNTERRIQLATKKADPRGDARPGWRIYTTLAQRLGHAWSYSSSADVMKEIARAVPAYSGVNYDLLRTTFGVQWPCDATHQDGCARFSTGGPSRKLKFVSVAPIDGTQALPGEFPFSLIAGRANYFWHHNNIMKKTHIPRREYNALLLLYPQGFVELCAEDAARIGVRDRRPVNVVSARGEMRVAARISPDVRPGTAYVPYFIQDMIEKFLQAHAQDIDQGEDSVIPVRIEKV